MAEIAGLEKPAITGQDEPPVARLPDSAELKILVEVEFREGPGFAVVPRTRHPGDAPILGMARYVLHQITLRRIDLVGIVVLYLGPQARAKRQKNLSVGQRLHTVADLDGDSWIFVLPDNPGT